VVPSPFGFHVFQRRRRRRPPSRRTLASRRGRPLAAAAAARELGAAHQENYVAALRARATIEVDPAARGRGEAREDAGSLLDDPGGLVLAAPARARRWTSPPGGPRGRRW